jgi:hypothetical protein
MAASRSAARTCTTTTVIKPTFIDAAILVHASRKRSPFHARAVAGLSHAGGGGDTLWFSGQIPREYLCRGDWAARG